MLEKSDDNEIENDAVRPKCDEEAAAGDEDAASKQEWNANDRAAAAKKMHEENDEVTSEDVKIGRLIEERRKYCKRRGTSFERSELTF